MDLRLRAWLLMAPGVSILVLGLAGGWTDPWMWAYCVAWVATVSYGIAGMDETLARERFNPPTSGADSGALKIVRVLGLAHLVVGALDSGRWHRTYPVPNAVRAAALAGMAVALTGVYRAMHENGYFSPVVRLQKE